MKKVNQQEKESKMKAKENFTPTEVKQLKGEINSKFFIASTPFDNCKESVLSKKNFGRNSLALCSNLLTDDRFFESVKMLSINSIS